MTLFSFIEIGILGAFGLFFIFWCKEITRMRSDISSVKESMQKMVEILKDIDTHS